MSLVFPGTSAQLPTAAAAASNLKSPCRWTGRLTTPFAKGGWVVGFQARRHKATSTFTHHNRKKAEAPVRASVRPGHAQAQARPSTERMPRKRYISRCIKYQSVATTFTEKTFAILSGPNLKHVSTDPASKSFRLETQILPCTRWPIVPEVLSACA